MRNCWLGRLGSECAVAGQQNQDSQEGEWVALALDQFPLLLMVSLSGIASTQIMRGRLSPD